MRLCAVAIIALLCAAAQPGAAQVFSAARVDEVVGVEGQHLPSMADRSLDSLSIVACRRAACAPIPMQVDERDANGRWVLDHGPESSTDDPPGVFDANDLMIFMAADAGERAAPNDLPAHQAAVELSLVDPLDGRRAWAYLLASSEGLPRRTRGYVEYDAINDRIRATRDPAATAEDSTEGAQHAPEATNVTMGFVAGMPAYLAIGDGPNLLDRLKVRASARLIFGLFRFSRSEDDLSSEFAGWHAGPIRVIRSQRQRIRLGWGIRSPTFGSYTYFYRASADLPVGLYLNFPATYFVSDVDIAAVLDFHGLAGWQLIVPGREQPSIVGEVSEPERNIFNETPASWFALRGPQLTLIEELLVGESLDSTRRRFLYREGPSASAPPESFAGEEPGVGYRLDRWEGVGAGRHQFAAMSYAVRNEVDLDAHARARRQPLQVGVRVMD